MLRNLETERSGPGYKGIVQIAEELRCFRCCGAFGVVWIHANLK